MPNSRPLASLTMRLVRITPEIETNATFKKSKVDIAKKSWAPQPSSADASLDRLYWLDGKTYRSLDGDSWQGIESGKAKL